MRAALLLALLAAIALWARSRSADDPANAGAADPAADSSGVGGLLEQIGARVRSAWTMPANPYEDEIRAAEVKFSLPDGLLGRVLWQESRFRPEIIDGRVPSPAGAIGIAQFMPATAAELGIDPADPHQAIPAAAKYLRALYNSLGNWKAALAGYNWGQGNVARKGLDAAPQETKDYVRDVAGDVGLA